MPFSSSSATKTVVFPIPVLTNMKAKILVAGIPLSNAKNTTDCSIINRPPWNPSTRSSRRQLRSLFLLHQSLNQNLQIQLMLPGGMGLSPRWQKWLSARILLVPARRPRRKKKSLLCRKFLKAMWLSIRASVMVQLLSLIRLADTFV
ncbi:hypothetical protein SDC9_142615 [bioreactor metagenome]|uniref:Uncharacterized protein n=1 Tax=bioreactor metagenome TaxID=1076179 RepID=A0A645E1M3_9ZZZZ